MVPASDQFRENLRLSSQIKLSPDIGFSDELSAHVGKGKTIYSDSEFERTTRNDDVYDISVC
jgi:hypothetical protein